MTRLVWFFGLITAAVGLGNGIGGKSNVWRLSLERDDVKKHLGNHKVAPNSSANQSVEVQKRLANHRTVPESAENHSVVLAEGQGYPAKTAAGSLTCMRWTGGTCGVLSCNEKRRAICEEGYCVCKPGSCADSEGKCVTNSNSQWIGEYSIRFEKSFLAKRPFLGVDKNLGSQPGMLGFSGVKGSITWLAAEMSSEKQWQIAQTPNGFVRLTNTKHPGSVLTIYNNRRRADFMQRRNQENSKMSDDNDLWPVLMNLEAATPLAATFQVRRTSLGALFRDGAGYELWDPENQVAIASADPESWGDSVVKQGVTECHTREDSCEGGKHLLTFDPALPAGALEEERAKIIAIGIFSPWQCLVVLVFCCCLPFCCNAGSLIAQTIEYLGSQVEKSAQAARDAAAEEERELRAFAQEVCGFWALESDIGKFEYELKFESTQVHIIARGRSQGASEWDSWFDTKFIGPDQLHWQDDNGTKFTLAFGDDTSTWSGRAMAVGGQEVSFTGKRTEPPIT